MFHRWSLSLGSALAVLALSGVASWVAVASAHAETGACPSSSTSQPFLRWGDSNYYSLMSGGDFEGSLSGWSLSGGAQKAAGSEPYAVTGKLGASSLALPAGARAQSPFMCASSVDRSFRFFARSEGTAASVRATVVYGTPLGELPVPVGTVELKSGWQPAPSLRTGAALASAMSSNGTVQLALRFTAVSGSSRIDDVFIDPRHR